MLAHIPATRSSPVTINPGLHPGLGNGTRFGVLEQIFDTTTLKGLKSKARGETPGALE